MARSGIELHVLASGSDGNCAVLKADGVSVMIDAGLSGRAIVKLAGCAGLDVRDLSAILITHEHGDHVRGAGVLSRRFNIPVHANRRTFRASNLGNVSGWNDIQNLSCFEIGDLSITPLPISHHAVDPIAYSLCFEGKRCLVATDLGRVTSVIQMEIERSDLIMIESNHDIDMLVNGTYPKFLKTLIMSEKGHLSNDDCAEALSRGGQRRRMIFLAHLSKNNNRPDLAKNAVAHTLDCSSDVLHCLDDENEIRCVVCP